MRREKNKTKKRLPLLIINMMLLVFIGGMSWFAYGLYRNKTIHTFIEQETQKMKPSFVHDVHQGRIGNSHVTAFFPVDAAGKRIVAAEEAVHGLIETETEKSSSKTLEKIVFVSVKESASHFASVRQLQLLAKTYPIQLLTPGTARKGGEVTLFLKENNEIFGLADFIKDQGAYQEILAMVLEETLSQQGLVEERQVAALEQFRNLSVSDLAFEYANAELLIVLPQSIEGLTQLTVPIEKIFPVVESTYLHASDLEAYQNYEAEERRKHNQKAIALTFDDGPSPVTTPLILDILKRYHAKATFFVLGQSIPGNEAILKRIVEEGHEVANHTWSHPNLTTLSAEQIREEITKTQDAIREVTGKTPTIMRPPYGNVNQAVMEAMNLPVIYWSVDTLDWQNRNPQMILENVKQNTQAGGIILMHDIHQATVDSLPSVLDYLQSQDYHFVTSSELLGTSLNPHHIYYNRDVSGPAQ